MKKKTALTIAFWTVYILTLSIALSGYEGFDRSLLVSSVVVAFQMTVVYLNILVLIPFLFEKKHFVLYAVGVLFVIGVLIVIRFQIPPYLVEASRTIEMRRRKITFASNVIMAYALSTAYYFVVEWFRNAQLKAELKFRQVEAELKYLKNQINPHFLFNTLNNIYTLCYLKDDKAPLAVMKLSDMMRYILTDSNAQAIELEREIQFIQNYLELQKLKTEEQMRIVFDVNGIRGRHKIAPMLLIVFFENCFKHGDIGINPDGWIKAELKVNEKDEMDFNICNSKGADRSTGSEFGHLGLENVMKRLSIQYKDRHSLDILEGEHEYDLHLTLKLDS